MIPFQSHHILTFVFIRLFIHLITLMILLSTTFQIQSYIVKILSIGMVPVAEGSKIASKVRCALGRASEYAMKVPVMVILKRFSNACWATAKLVTRVWTALAVVYIANESFSEKEEVMRAQILASSSLRLSSFFSKEDRELLAEMVIPVGDVEII